VSVPKEVESVESNAIQRWRPDSWGTAEGGQLLGQCTDTAAL
jgi:hypothetical protein